MEFKTSREIYTSLKTHKRVVCVGCGCGGPRGLSQSACATTLLPLTCAGGGRAGGAHAPPRLCAALPPSTWSDIAFSAAVAYQEHKIFQERHSDTASEHGSTYKCRCTPLPPPPISSPHSLTALAQTVGWGWASARQDGSETAAGALPLHEWGHAPHPSLVRSRQALVNVLNCAGRGPEPAKRAVDGLVRVEVELVVRRLP